MQRVTFLLPLLASTLALGAEVEPQCNPPRTTYDFNMCPDPVFERATQDLTRYLQASRQSEAKDAQSLAALNAAQSAWEKYVNSHCDAVYAHWREGTIRNQKYTACRLGLMRERTHELWFQYLKPVDKSPPVLPEPPEK